MDRIYLFSRRIAGESVDFYRDDSIPGVHIKAGVGTISGPATADAIQRAIALAYEQRHQFVDGLAFPVLPSTESES